MRAYNFSVRPNVNAYSVYMELGCPVPWGIEEKDAVAATATLIRQLANAAPGTEMVITIEKRG